MTGRAAEGTPAYLPQLPVITHPNMTAEYYQDQYRVLHGKMPMFGTGVEESLDPIPEADFHRPVGHRTIAQLIGHMVAWRKNSALRFQKLPRPKIELGSPEDWPDYSRKTKADMLAELAETKELLLDALAAVDYGTLEERIHPDYYYHNRHALDGAVQHDIYHLGQINLIASVLRNTAPH
ncbi:DinB family protein [Neolewinella xylanilytica]|uniref:DinB family protein n=1 Tax=Neolewinella xylanilytica TaxID=1514080 RepID=A0A2S6I6W1_9BACT|nr:DinB family protein [Neolewinella xylanilytica]PPK87228.1 DinB family protein [Neolewinella xylanilytica]